MPMYKITKGNVEEFADTYPDAIKKYRRICKITSKECGCQFGVFTRLYCDLGDGYKLMMVAGQMITNALLPENI